MKNHTRNFNKLVSGLAGDREIRFELISTDQPMDSRRTLHRHECHQLRIHIPTDKSAPVDIEVVYPRITTLSPFAILISQKPSATRLE